MIVALVISLAIALFWLYRFRKMDKYGKKPERLIYLAFFAGVLAVLPCGLLEAPFEVPIYQNFPLPPIKDLFISFLWVAVVEEFFKFLAVRLTVYRSREFNEVMDAMIYMISAALGFAATENVGYLLGFGFSVWFLRAILSYLGHVSYSAVLGYYLGKAKIDGRPGWLWPGFVLAICLHWLYDAFFTIGYIRPSDEMILLSLVIWVFGLVLTFILFKKARAVSPFRATHLLPTRLTRPCRVCGKTISAKALICHHCGEKITLDEEEITLKASGEDHSSWPGGGRS